MPPEQQEPQKGTTEERENAPIRATPPPIPHHQGNIARKAAYTLTFLAGAAGMYAIDHIPEPKPHNDPLPLKRPETPNPLTMSGTTEAAPGRLARISLSTNQAVAFVDVKVGDHVKKGHQVFSHWESPEGLDATKTEITRAKHTLTAATARSAAALQNLERLLRLRGAIAAQELDDAQALARVRSAELAAAKAALDIAELRFAEAEFHFQQAFVTSPIDGTVVEVAVTPGERRQIGGPFRGVTVLDSRVLSVRCAVTPAQLLTLQHTSGKNLEGLRATVNVGGKTYPATVKTVGPRVDTPTGTTPVILEVQNTDAEIRCGLPVAVSLSQKK